ncbi:Uncharacterised protein at_DN0701 [Pycnogonum litorale]
MTRDRFYLLRSNLYMVNVIEDDASGTDRRWKVRPIFDSVRKRCLKLDMEEELSIDEQMVPFRGRLNINQYLKGKPHPWGVKIFVLAEKSGKMYHRSYIRCSGYFYVRD